MSNVVLSSSEADASAAAAVEQHHAQMAGALELLVETFLAATADRGNPPAAVTAKADLVKWCRDELVPHAVAEEKAMYPAAHGTPEGRLLVDGMLGEHTVITGLVDEIAATPDPVRAAAVAKALQVLFGSHLAKENELVLPLLSAAPGVSLAEVLAGMHELLGEDAHAEPGGEGELDCADHSCACGETDRPGYPELDAREVPHAIRHATIFGALDGVRPGGGMVLLAPHDPRPLLAQLEQRLPGQFEVEYLQRGPDAWRLVFIRRSPA